MKNSISNSHSPGRSGAGRLGLLLAFVGALAVSEANAAVLRYDDKGCYSEWTGTMTNVVLDLHTRQWFLQTNAVIVKQRCGESKFSIEGGYLGTDAYGNPRVEWETEGGLLLNTKFDNWTWFSRVPNTPWSVSTFSPKTTGNLLGLEGDPGNYESNLDAAMSWGGMTANSVWFRSVDRFFGGYSPKYSAYQFASGMPLYYRATPSGELVFVLGNSSEASPVGGSAQKLVLRSLIVVR